MLSGYVSDKTQFWYLSLNSKRRNTRLSEKFFFQKNKPLYIYENNLCSYFYLDDKKPRKLGMLLHQNI